MKRRLFWPALTTAMMLCLTLGLGIWQVQRLAWKTGLLAEIDRGEAAPATPLPQDPLPFHRYTITGHFAQQQARYGAEVRQGPLGPVMGVHVVGVLLAAHGPAILIDRGWAVDAVLPPAPDDRVTIEGYIRPPEHTPWMGATDDPARRRFYALDPQAIGASLGFATVAPFTLIAMGPPGHVPDPVQALPRPPNDHLSYALTWFSLSVALIMIFVVYVYQASHRETVT